VDPVHLAGAGRTAIVEHKLAEPVRQMGMEFSQGRMERAFAYAGWTGQDDKTSHNNSCNESTSASPWDDVRIARAGTQSKTERGAPVFS